MIAFRYATPDDIDPIVADIRRDDVREMAALGTTPRRALTIGVQDSVWAAVATYDGVPACLFGVSAVNVLAGMGAPWMLATNVAVRHQRALLPTAKAAVAAMHDTFPRLTNLVDDRSLVSKRWLQWLGFSFALEPILIRGVPFRIFWSGDWD